MSDDVTSNRGEGRWRREVRAALEVIGPVGHALPVDGDAGGASGDGEQFQYGKEIGGVGSSYPFLPIARAITIEIRKIGGAIGGNAVLLEPGVGDSRGRILKLVGAEVHSAASDARVAVQINRVGNEVVVAGVDAGGIGLEMEIGAIQIHKQRRIGEIIGAETGKRGGATVCECTAAVNVGATRSGIVIDNAIPNRLTFINTPALDGGRVGGNRAVNQGGRIRAASAT